MDSPRYAIGKTKSLEEAQDDIRKEYDEKIEYVSAIYDRYSDYPKLLLYWLNRWHFIYRIRDEKTGDVRILTKDEYVKRLTDEKDALIRKLPYHYVRRTCFKDNQGYYNISNGHSCSSGYRDSIRVPSLKRSDRVWRNFYRLFPFLKEYDTFKGAKLKHID